jgi:hypothetical protein
MPTLGMGWVLDTVFLGLRLVSSTFAVDCFDLGAITCSFVLLHCSQSRD